MEKKYNFKPYPYKHYESVFTRFYQGYILPRKFGIDKRKLHYSTLIISKHLNRSDALKELEKSPYPSKEMLEIDKEYFLKKLNWTEKKFNYYLSKPEKPHSSYPSEKKLFDLSLKIYKFFKLS